MNYKSTLVAAAVAAAMTATGPSAAADWPTKPIHLLVPFPSGGVTDALARSVSAKLGDALGQPVVIDNRPGGGTIIATREAVGAAPDGYTLLVGVTQLVINPVMRDDVPYDAQEQLEPIVLLGDTFGVAAVHKDFPAKTFGELLEMAKKERVNVAMPGIGSPYHVALANINQTLGTKFEIIGYQGSGQSINDVVGGHVPVTFDSLVSVKSHIESGALRGLAVLAPVRSPGLADVPSTTELGQPDIVVRAMVGLMAPAGTPAAIVERVNAEVNKILTLPETKEQADKFGMRLIGGSAADFKATYASMADYYARVIRASGIKPGIKPGN